MTPRPGGVTAQPCGICGVSLVHEPWPCRDAHADHCHDCWQESLAASSDAREHRPLATPLVLSERDVVALARYRVHRDRVRGTGPCVPRLEEEPL